MYCICPVASGTRWDFSKTSNIAVGKEPIASEPTAKFLALHILVDRSAWCPENLQFHVALFHTAEEAALDLVNAFNCDNYNFHDQDDDDATNDDATTAASKQLDTDRWLTLQALDPLWVKQDDGRSAIAICHHLQVIPIEESTGGKSMELNTYCPQIQPDEWHKASSGV